MRIVILLLTLGAFLLGGCAKQKDWLSAKRQSSDIVPESLIDLQAILDNSELVLNMPSLGLVGSDNVHFHDAAMVNISSIERNSYLWNKDIFGEQASLDYNHGFKNVAYSNVVLERLQGIEVTRENESIINNLKGQALFMRSFAFFELSNLFCKPYDAGNAQTDLGLSLRLTSNIYHVEKRSTVLRTFQRIVEDLTTASNLLPETPKYRTRASRAAAHALLSRVYLVMQDYNNSKKHADTVIQGAYSFLDFNGSSVSILKAYRFPSFSEGNPEIILYATSLPYYAMYADLGNDLGGVDTGLYNSYVPFDLRKTYFYALEGGVARFRGSYSGSEYGFAGLAINEVYFNRAECYARQGNASAALADLNFVLKYRYQTNAFHPIDIKDSDSVLNIILRERRKEFPTTGQLRWMDLRRLNLDPARAIALKRVVSGNEYKLEPNSRRYVYPLPAQEIKGGVQQNER